MEIQDNTAERTLSISKKLKAPVEKVWEAWSNPEHIAMWWGPKELPVKIVNHDFKIGGKWRYTMKLPDGNTFISDGTYADIVNYKKISTSADFKPLTIGVVLQIIFIEEEKGTRIDFHVLHPTIAYCKQQEGAGFYNGWNAAFERLEHFLNK
ncbi:hypothetical protein LCGC14_0679610 [marine sediment metagenome]|uniref:Activator of HSP90 ATPase n=2 Tax=root TaxID=1 RepID=A0A831QR31_9FLAO|nr:activator of HSP90 ATPase [Pricia sp.]HEA21187.1 activator of HSP90 ATPase [Pricia antarctica]